ncbi:epoxide hydrolase [Lacisediminihabitans profunda]|uniref:Epoxide hydrolase n=1 Tax=Lacisediminihabitans profunda TaxID=2594790 RepID=A0A5C8UX82_9MICO|nr:epoxide hydrolase [Lacisediminihabitans profunda]
MCNQVDCTSVCSAHSCATERCTVEPETRENQTLTTSTPAPSTLVRPFTVAISDSEIDDLKQRLARTRWPSQETVPDWSQGVRLENAKALITYWEREYDWRRFESELNRFPQFLSEIDGLDTYFIHVRSKNPNAMPLILTHGWPGSIVEFLKLIGPLTDPAAFGGRVEDSFDVVIPSLPGFGFSQKPTEDGWDVRRIAIAWVELMRRLGYQKWAAQGGDWGAVVTSALGAMRPTGLLGIHLNTQYAFPAQIPDTLSPEERYAVDTLALYTGELGGSNHLHSTKPETVGIALADSPAGQAAWIYEKFQSKTDNDGLAEDALSTDDMLDAISLYWFTNSAASSGRIYWENRSGSMAGPKLTLPVAVTVFPRDIPRLPRNWIEDTYANLIHYGEADKGGHFAALEQPEILVSEIRAGLRSLRS